MNRLVFSIVFLSLFIPLFAKAADQTCTTDTRVVDVCYSVHGTLQMEANGRPRIHPTGTKRLLGIVDKSDAVDARLYWPDDIDQVLSKDPEAVLAGDFLVCPFTHEKPHKMKFVCIQSVKNLHKESYTHR